MSNSDPNEPSASPEQITCPNCQGLNAPTAAVCSWCGNTLSPAAGAPTRPVTEATGLPAQAQYSPPQPQAEVPAQGYMPPAQSTYQQPTPTPTPTPTPMQQVAPAPRKKSNRNIFLIIGGIVLLLICGCIGSVLLLGGGIFAATQPVVDASERFLVAVRDGDYSRAYDMCTSRLQRQIGNAANFESGVQEIRPSKWSINSRSIENDRGRVQGVVTLTDGAEANFQVDLTNVGGEWKIDGYDVDRR